MLKHLPDQSCAPPDVYERAFVRTVLRLNGVAGTPTGPEIAAAVDTFHRYCLRASQVMNRNLAIDDGWLKGRMPEPAAMEQAFLFVRFDSVLLPNAGQVTAFNEWLAAGILH